MTRRAMLSPMAAAAAARARDACGSPFYAERYTAAASPVPALMSAAADCRWRDFAPCAPPSRVRHIAAMFRCLPAAEPIATPRYAAIMPRRYLRRVFDAAAISPLYVGFAIFAADFFILLLPPIFALHAAFAIALRAIFCHFLDAAIITPSFSFSGHAVSLFRAYASAFCADCRICAAPGSFP